MATSTWNYIAGGSAILTALGGGLAQLGGATGSTFLSDVGPIMAAIGGTGLAVAGAGAFATSSQQAQTNSLAGQGLILAALSGQTAQSQATAAAQTAQAAAAISSPVPTVTRTEAATGGLAGALAEILAFPLKLLKRVIGG